MNPVAIVPLWHSLVGEPGPLSIFRGNIEVHLSKFRRDFKLAIPLIQFAVALPALALAAVSPLVLAPLLILCGVVMIAIPIAAARGKLHMPGYSGIALLALVAGLLIGRISAANGIKGSLTGFALSAIFFLLIAVAIGSVIALACYRPRPSQETESTNSAE